MSVSAQSHHPHYASLYVGDLDPDVSEKDLWTFFSRAGTVSSARVCLDTLTRRSLGYGYVNFSTVQEAEHALDTLNNQPIHDHPCRIMWSQRDPSIRRSGIGNIYIKNLDNNITHKELHDTFSVFGNILSCKVATDENGKSKGYGFVHFESVEASEKAIAKTNGMSLEGSMNKIYVTRHISKKERAMQKANSWTNVFVKNLDPSVDEEKLKALFSQFGKITSVCVKANTSGHSADGQPRDTLFGFVNFEKHEDAQRALDEMNGKAYLDRELYVARAQTKAERQEELLQKYNQMKLEFYKKYQGTNLFVKNLEDCIDEERLLKEFGQFGRIKSVKIKEDSKGNSCGFGFICFMSPEEASFAISGLNARILPGCVKPLHVTLHEPKEIRRQKLANQHQQAKNIGGYQHFFRQPMFYPPYSQNGVPIMGPRQGRTWPPVQPGFVYPIAPTPAGPTNVPAGQHRPPVSYPPRTEPTRIAPILQTPVVSAPSHRPPNSPVHDVNTVPIVSTDPLTRETLEVTPESGRLALLSDRLFRLIAAKQHQQLAGKLTGMILESCGNSVDQLLNLTTNDAALTEKINEAIKTLDEYNELSKSTAS
ncbi:polyadenylate-binding protein 4-like [Schistocerca gregaria]|uniref:polyadenylate-binding protein 4-like n=1 Tax=Schistocerca gregaria TaxID=7010 RepID=UPI00211E1C80|nr:polyadenylate-binding protein 4-like [Schistocerca gregaria]